MDWLTKIIAQGPTIEKVSELTVTTEKTEPVVDFGLTAVMKAEKSFEPKKPAADLAIEQGSFWNFSVFEKTVFLSLNSHPI